MPLHRLRAGPLAGVGTRQMLSTLVTRGVLVLSTGLICQRFARRQQTMSWRPQLSSGRRNGDTVSRNSQYSWPVVVQYGHLVDLVLRRGRQCTAVIYQTRLDLVVRATVQARWFIPRQLRGKSLLQKKEEVPQTHLRCLAMQGRTYTQQVPRTRSRDPPFGVHSLGQQRP